MKTITRDEAFTLLKKYNKDPFHIQHALTVEAVMKWYANELGYGEDAEYWGIIGAGMVIATLPTVLIYLLLSKQVQESFTVGAVKG